MKKAEVQFSVLYLLIIYTENLDFLIFT